MELHNFLYDSVIFFDRQYLTRCIYFIGGNISSREYDTEHDIRGSK